MMINDRIELSIDNGVAHVLLSRRDKMNALDAKMMDAVIQVTDQINADPSIRAVVLSGDGKAFCAGLDMQNFSNMLNEDEQQDADLGNLAKRTHGIANLPQAVAWRWHELNVPVIAVLHGVVFGGGFQIALGADMRYAAPQTQFSVMEIKWGLVPDMSGTQLMRHLASEDIVRELSYTGRTFDSHEAKEYGFVTKVVDDPLAQAMKTANEIASKNPDAIRACKRLFNQANYLSAAEGLLMESVEQDDIIGSPNQIETVAAQIEKRPAKYN